MNRLQIVHVLSLVMFLHAALFYPICVFDLYADQLFKTGTFFVFYDMSSLGLDSYTLCFHTIALTVCINY